MIKTEGIVLRENKYKESSKILSVYTRKNGKVSVMARGANRPKSRLLANTQVFSYNEYQFRRGRNFYYINQADIIDSFYAIRENMERLVYGFFLLELVEKSVPMEEANEKIFFLLLKTLKTLAVKEKDFLKLILAFELKYISFLGYRPFIESCVICGRGQAREFRFSNFEGGIICDNCYTKDLRAKALDRKTYELLVRLMYMPLDRLEEIEASDVLLNKLQNIIESYILYNIDRRGFNSLDFFKINKFNLARTDIDKE